MLLSRQRARIYYFEAAVDATAFLSRRGSPLLLGPLRLSSANRCHQLNRCARFLSLLGTVATLAARSGFAQAAPQTDAAVGNTRYEMQRALFEIDERRRRLESSLEPVDSVLRLMAADTTRIANARRLRSVDQNMDRVWNAAGQLGQADGSDLSRAFGDAVTATARDFAIPEGTLSARIVVSSSGLASAERSSSAVVVVNGLVPPYDTPLWEKIRRSDFGRQRVPRVTTADVSNFQAAVSDSGFQVYKQSVIAAFARRMDDMRQSRDTARAEVQRLRQRAATLAHAIGTQEVNGTQFDARLVYFGLPAFAAVLIVLLLMPLMYKRAEVQQWLLTSGMLLELATIVIVTAATLLLALAGRIHAEVVGALLGALSGYMLGRVGSRRATNGTVPAPAPRLTAPRAATPQPALAANSAVPAVLRGREGQPSLPAATHSAAAPHSPAAPHS